MDKLIQNIKLYIKSFLPAILWAGLIFYFSHQSTLPGFDLSLPDFLFKKGAHLFVYFILYLLLYYAFQKSSLESKKNWLIILLICILYAMSDELHQSFIPGRTATIRDIMIDFLGSSTAMLKIYNYV